MGMVVAVPMVKGESEKEEGGEGQKKRMVMVEKWKAFSLPISQLSVATGHYSYVNTLSSYVNTSFFHI